MNQQISREARDRAVYVFFLVLQVILVAVGIRNHLHAINPDGVAYLRIAEYYFDGNMNLALNGYWGPLLSWLIAALLPLGIDHIFAGKLATGLSAVVFLSGALRIFQLMLRRGGSVLIGCALTALIGTQLAVSSIGADLLVSGLLLWGLSFTVGRDTSEAPVQAFSAGLCYGLAFLAKSVALPVSVALVILLESISFSEGRTVSTIIRRIGWSFIGIGLLALPWIITISWHYGTVTFSTSARINYAVVGPEVQDVGQYFQDHYYTTTYHSPPPGRITSWEDPDPRMYKDWSPFADMLSFKHQLKLLAKNLKYVLTTFRSFDVVGLGFTAALLGFVFRSQRNSDEKWRLCCPVLAVAAGVYLPVFAEAYRYYIVCYPLLLAAALGFVRNASKSGVNFRGAERTRREPFLFGRYSSNVAAALVVASFLPQAAIAVQYVFSHAESPEYFAAAQVAQAVRNAPSGGLASFGELGGIAFPVALYGSYLSGRPFRGTELPCLQQKILPLSRLKDPTTL